jgi:hypothetical protein
MQAALPVAHTRGCRIPTAPPQLARWTHPPVSSLTRASPSHLLPHSLLGSSPTRASPSPCRALFRHRLSVPAHIRPERTSLSPSQPRTAAARIELPSPLSRRGEQVNATTSSFPDAASRRWPRQIRTGRRPRRRGGTGLPHPRHGPRRSFPRSQRRRPRELLPRMRDDAATKVEVDGDRPTSTSASSSTSAAARIDLQRWWRPASTGGEARDGSGRCRPPAAVSSTQGPMAASPSSFPGHLLLPQPPPPSPGSSSRARAANYRARCARGSVRPLEVFLLCVTGRLDMAFFCRWATRTSWRLS